MHYKISATHLSKNDNVFFKSMLQLIQIQLDDTWTYEENADIILTDIENPLGREFWEKTSQQQDKLVIAYGRQNTCNAKWFLPKPIRVHALIKQLNAIATLKSATQPTEETPPAPKHDSSPPSPIAQTHLLNNIVSTSLSCGATDVPSPNDYFEPKHSLLGLIQSILDKGDAKCLTCAQGEVMYIYPQQRRCFTSKVNFNRLTLKQKQSYASIVDQVSVSDVSEATLPQDVKAKGLENYAVDTILWLVTLCASQGRLMVGSDKNSYVRLKQWPNFALLPCQPVHLRIAAFMLKNATTLETIAAKTNVDFSTLVDFFNACKVVNLVIETTEQNVPADTPKKSSAEHYLFKNILKRLSSHE